MSRRLNEANIALGILLAWIGAIIICGLGYILNLIHVVHAFHSGITGELILRIVGLFLPILGAFLGYIP